MASGMASIKRELYPRVRPVTMEWHSYGGEEYQLKYLLDALLFQTQTIFDSGKRKTDVQNVLYGFNDAFYHAKKELRFFHPNMSEDSLCKKISVRLKEVVDNHNYYPTDYISKEETPVEFLLDIWNGKLSFYHIPIINKPM